MYQAPVGEIALALRHAAGLGDALDSGLFGDLSADEVGVVLGEAGRFASQGIAPLAAVGDREGVAYDNASVRMPAGWRDLYRRWTEGGWNGVADPIEHGGQGLPLMLSAAVMEMWSSGSMAFAIGPTLTMAAAAAIADHASDELKALYLPKLVSGEWMGTMNLTEPQSGSDLSGLRTRAEGASDGSYRVFGQKIFITYGEHDLTDNIVHLVLARLPDAPAGTRGLSLFLVPKFLPEADGRTGRRNDVFCASVEHKLGIHASPTCTMIYGDGYGDVPEPGAIGWLVGEKHRGLACMFSMMNRVRLVVGVQGVAVAEAATQKAFSYALERRQGRRPGAGPDTMAPIAAHPDIKRTLLTMQGLTQAARCLVYACAHALDMARIGDGTLDWNDRAALLTPVAKAFASEVGVDVASLGVQVHGGMGYIEETGAAVLLRDARIGPIYEGTNGIQAIDLVTRKLGLSGGSHVKGYIAELSGYVDELRDLDAPTMSGAIERLSEALRDLEVATEFMREAMADGRPDDALAGATPYLRLFALAAGGAYLARMAVACGADQASVCRFYAHNLASQSSYLRRCVVDGAESVAAASTEG